MSTKKDNVARFDCYAVAEDDEEMFVLLARDKVAPTLVRLWAAIRVGDLEAVLSLQRETLKLAIEYKQERLTNHRADKAAEAKVCAIKMELWRSEHPDV
jgi:hypothetical protein